MIQKARPSVEAIRSPCLTLRSVTGVTGNPPANGSQWAPPSYDTYTPVSVPAYNKPRRSVSSRTTRTGSPSRNPVTRRVHVFP